MTRTLSQAEFDAEAAKQRPTRTLTQAQFDAESAASDSPVQAGLEGAADSATFGLSKKMQADYYAARGSPDLAAQRAQANPIAHGVGEFAGFLTPGPGMVGKVARGVAGAGKAGMAVEGGLWGLSAAMNEDHMGDSRLTSENIAAGVLGGALVGVVAGTVFGKIGELGKSALIKAFGGTALKDTLGSLAEAITLKSLNAEKDYGKRNLENRANEVARFALDNKLVDRAGSMKASAGKADARAQQAYAFVQNRLEQLDQVGAAKGSGFDPGAAADKLQAKIDEMAHNPSMTEARSKLQKFVDDFRDQGTPGAPGEIDRSVKIGGKPLSDFPPAVQEQIIKANGLKPGPAVEAVEGEGPRDFREAWDTMTGMKKNPDIYRLRKDLQDEIFQQAERVDPRLGEELKTINREHANALEFRTLAENKGAKEGYTMGDYAAGALGFHAGGIPGLVAPIAKKAIRERGGFAVASALDSLAQNGTLPKIANGFQLLMKSRLADPGFGGPFRAVLETAAAKGSMDLLQTHLSLASSQGQDYMMAVGLEHEEPQTVAAHTDRANRLAQLSNSVDTARQAIDQSVGRVLGENSPGRPQTFKKTEPSMEQFEGLKKKLEILVSNSENNPHLADLAPTTAALAQMATQNAATYLLGKAPKNPTEGLPIALQRPWKPAKGELRDWMRMVDAVADPRSVLDAMRQGTVHQDQLETLQTVYPRLYREFQDRMRERLSAWEKPLDRRTKAHVGALLGDLNDPAVTQLIQAAHQRAIPPPAPAPDGRQVIDAEKNDQTQAQRLEGAK